MGRLHGGPPPGRRACCVYFSFIPYYQFWAITIFAPDVFVVWALAAHGRDLTVSGVSCVRVAIAHLRVPEMA
ncbi:MAG TPA: hypothetical protein VIW24_25470 [Aldersonia sp.]